MTEEKERYGLTKVTSVSVSREFSKILKKYNLSPTEVFRKGMGVTLYSLGIKEYNTEINNLRLDEANKILKGIDERNSFLIKLDILKKAVLDIEKSFNDIIKKND